MEVIDVRRLYERAGLSYPSASATGSACCPAPGRGREVQHRRPHREHHPGQRHAPGPVFRVPHRPRCGGGEPPTGGGHSPGRLPAGQAGQAGECHSERSLSWIGVVLILSRFFRRLLIPTYAVEGRYALSAPNR